MRKYPNLDYFIIYRRPVCGFEDYKIKDFFKMSYTICHVVFMFLYSLK